MYYLLNSFSNELYWNLRLNSFQYVYIISFFKIRYLFFIELINTYLYRNSQNTLNKNYDFYSYFPLIYWFIYFQQMSTLLWSPAIQHWPFTNLCAVCK